MIGFIEVHDLENNPYILNVNIIESVEVNEKGHTVIYPINSKEVRYYKVLESYEEIREKMKMILM